MKGNTFQTGLIIIFAILGAVGFGFFALYEPPESRGESIGRVEIWGTIDAQTMEAAIKVLRDSLPKEAKADIAYLYKDPRTFNEELVDALAADAGPDIFLLRHTDIIEQLNKVFVVPYEWYTQRKFKDTYLEGAEVFLHNDGVIAFPFIVDPLIMYWNRDILSREGVATPPEYWVEFLSLSPKLTKIDSSANILLATIPFGEYRNVTNAKEIISMLMLQTDIDIARFNPVDGRLIIELFQDIEDAGGESPVVSAMRYYTQFSDPIKSVYSWNRALSESKRAFLSGDLAFYFGYASELENIRRSNPNLNFDIARMPQIQDDNTPATYAEFLGLAVTKSSDNPNGSVRVASQLASTPVLTKIHENIVLPPVTRTLLGSPAPDDVQPILYQSALISRGWLEPDREAVDIVFRDMIESISSGRQRIPEAVYDAEQELRNLAK